MARIGIYGSSFDPITNVHLWTASTIAHRAKLDQVIFLPCANNRRDKKLHTTDEHRWAMLQLAIAENDCFVSNDYEIKERAGVGKQFTYFTMEYFKQCFPDDDVFFIMGADLLRDLDHPELPVEKRWKYREDLIKNNRFIVMARNQIDLLKVISKSPLLRNHDDGRFHLLDKGLSMEISSTYIREELAMGGEPRYLLPEVCYDYIKQHKLYELK
ncbi:nicotinate (nicotinamide) nucleotide adenylyltransferase [Fictibacillus macauensis ZFHKF-1]|uniref:Probable nicotinate-nucleotide adenylyltransferase n=1 Tax=Fictibacillus macauensis ZFHKF-1 TaxID=1196324 RepID=I8IZP2_9BACL|nr:nicotinate (nicotinamide) nucleotide adenylyltransferase [Fictibacillus macauensis]EIT84946.1 nicotinate (nicotinamide) nucleotide adenylyltransferase [Fictibacillus macauensis ZFHKF-1]